ncbi:purple acid phosphatase family protein [Pedobacter sp. GR22-10]|uniref:purple acid phosphatase family protein n=1 Tax=Pedobacter sp. GR22-10 TaxID=2994472 RepID=UPI002246E7C3|nr:metallophosphoesterase family protein [Pedobacter sp. GR22-10]MCX2432236.1 metallophosphoesterase family protein [Pedobacter sp. GR22-10]
MKSFIKSILIITLLSSGVLTKLSAQNFSPTQYPDRVILTWAGDPATSQTVNWRTDTTIMASKAQIKAEDANPALEKAITSYDASSTVLNGRNNYETAKYHHVTFTNLKPATVYAYRVGSGEHWSEWFQFTTASAKNEPFSFIYLGDAQNDIRSKWSRVIRKAFSHQPDARFIIHTGDLINRSNNDQEWGEWHYGGGFINGMIPSIPSPGNHEYVRDDQRKLILDPHWGVQYTFAGNGPKGLESSVYYVDYQDVRIISLDSQMIILDEASAKAQYEWLEKVLKENKKLWTVITFHHPIFSTAKSRDNKAFRERFKPLFDQYHIDLVLQGHDHTYSRGQNLPRGLSGRDVSGPVYLVSVAGPKMYQVDGAKWMDVSLENTQLFQVIHVDGDKLKFEAYKTSGELFDAFSLQKTSRNRAAAFTDLNPALKP